MVLISSKRLCLLHSIAYICCNYYIYKSEAVFKYSGGKNARLKPRKEPAVQVSDTTKADWKTDAGDQKKPESFLAF